MTTPTVSDDNGAITPTRTDSSGLNSGDLFPVGETVISYEADDGVNPPVTCNFTIIVTDNEKPVVTNCPGNINESVAFDEDGKIITYTPPGFTDNCPRVSIIQTAGKASGEKFPVGTTTNTFEVNDGNGNIASCSFDVIITREEEDTPPEFDNCPSNITRDNNIGECGAIVTFDTPTVTDDSGELTPTRTDSSGLNSGDLFPVGETIISYEADDGVNPPVTCSFTIIVNDNEKPEFENCPSEPVKVSLKEGESYKIPDYSETILVDDNCDPNPNFTQTPVPGTEYSEEGNYEITITTTDAYGNIATCEVNLQLTTEKEPSFDCPQPTQFDPLQRDMNCMLVIPDYTGSIQNIENVDDPVIKQTATETLDKISVSLQIFEGEGGEMVGECTFEVDIQDSISPTINGCESQSEKVFINEGSSYVLPNYISNLEISDNCDPSLDIIQQPEGGTEITESTIVEIEVKDDAGNISTCEIFVEVEVVPDEVLVISCPDEVVINPDSNCDYIMPDLKDLINVSIPEAQISQSIAANTIIESGTTNVKVTASYNGQVETCDITIKLVDDIPPTLVCPSDKIVSLSAGEIYIIEDYTTGTASDNCSEVTVTQDPVAGTEVTDDVTVFIEAKDAAGNISSCETVITIVSGDKLEIACPADKIEQFNDQCEFIMPDYREDAVIINGEGAEVTQTPEPGTIVDIAEVVVTLTAESETESESCTFQVFIEDKTPPVLNLITSLNLALDSNGRATLSFDDIDSGSFDNCAGEVIYSLGRTDFNCKYLGQNTVEVTAMDLAGNTTTSSVQINVTAAPGICSGPVPESDYIFVYPNPNTGSFKIATPADVIIYRIEVFDHRGRYISAKNYGPEILEYTMELQPLQEAVYVLKLYTNEGLETERIIFKY